MAGWGLFNYLFPLECERNLTDLGNNISDVIGTNNNKNSGIVTEDRFLVWLWVLIMF
jgi:hypothetical protein